MRTTTISQVRKKNSITGTLGRKSLTMRITMATSESGVIAIFNNTFLEEPNKEHEIEIDSLEFSVKREEFQDQQYQSQAAAAPSHQSIQLAPSH